MRPLRLDIVRRLVASVLVGALGLSLVPAVGAQGDATSLSAVLSDAEAFEQALAAARAADPGADPLEVFAHAYAAAVGDVSAEVLVHLLGRASLAGVQPPAHDEALATTKVQVPPTTSAAPAAPATEAAAGDGPAARVPSDGPLPTLREQAPSTRPRAP